MMKNIGCGSKILFIFTTENNALSEKAINYENTDDMKKNILLVAALGLAMVGGTIVANSGTMSGMGSHPVTAAMEDWGADTVFDGFEAVEVMEDDDYLTPAVAYYQKLGREHPLFDVIEGDDYQAIADSASVVLAQFPGDLFSLSQRSRAYYNLGEKEKSLQDALKIYCEPNDDAFPWSLVDYLTAVDPAMVKRNLAPYTDYYLANPDTPVYEYCTIDYLIALASAERNLNNPQQAFKVAKIAGKMDADDESAIIIMSTILLQNGSTGEALQLLKPYVQDLEMVSPSVFHNYIIALRNDGRSNEAYKLIGQRLKCDLDPETRWNLLTDEATIYAANGDYKKALNLFDSLIKEMETMFDDPEEVRNYSNLPELYLRRGIIYSILGNKDKAEADINHTLSFTKDEENCTGLEVTAYSWLGDRKNALKWMEILSKYSPQSNYPTYAILGDTDEAIRELKVDFDNHSSSPVQIEYDPNYIKLRITPEYKKLAKSYKPLRLK